MKKSAKSAGEKRGRGRPKFEPTPELCKKVELRAALGWAEEDIAREIGVAENTLRKHFAEELRFGRLKVLGENLDRIRDAADSGNVSAMKYLDERMRVQPVGRSSTVPMPKPEKLGKKQEAQRDAASDGAGTGWADVINQVMDASSTKGAKPN